MDKRVKTTGCDNKKNVAVTIGDPGGIGPEIAISLFNHNICQKCNLILIGNINIFNQAKKILSVKQDIKEIKNISEFSQNKINVINIETVDKITLKQTSAANGKLAFKSIKTAIKLAKNGAVQAIVTSPISKEGLKLAGIDFPGHTEILAKFTRTDKYRMLFVSKFFNVLLHTIHIPLKDVSFAIKKIDLEETILIGIDFCKKYLKKEKPLIFVSGLNPHAGENGKIGLEEKDYILPIIENLKNHNIKGPFPPDTIFFKALHEKPDLIIAMYHDQGLIPLKLLDFHGAVNVTLGIPFVRTSPDHGTAFDIAWKGIANNQSMLNAVKLAIKFAQKK